MQGYLGNLNQIMQTNNTESQQTGSRLLSHGCALEIRSRAPTFCNSAPGQLYVEQMHVEHQLPILPSIADPENEA